MGSACVSRAAVGVPPNARCGRCSQRDVANGDRDGRAPHFELIPKHDAFIRIDPFWIESNLLGPPLEKIGGALTLLTPCVKVVCAMIESFACAETEKIFRGQVSRRLPTDIQRTARRKLLQLQAATELREMAVPPGNRLEGLKGRRAGQHSIRVNDQWRICFRWEGSAAHEVEMVDYH